MSGHFRTIDQLPPGWKLVIDERPREGIALAFEVISPRGNSAMFTSRGSVTRGIMLELADAAGAAPGERPGVMPRP
jgi:hypothetical protein